MLLKALIKRLSRNTGVPQPVKRAWRYWRPRRSTPLRKWECECGTVRAKGDRVVLCPTCWSGFERLVSP
jgi:hypothetical protein